MGNGDLTAGRRRNSQRFAHKHSAPVVGLNFTLVSRFACGLFRLVILKLFYVYFRVEQLNKHTQDNES